MGSTPPPKFLMFKSRFNSAADYSISLKFSTEFDHMTTATLQLFKVKGSKGQRSRSQPDSVI